MEEKKQVVGGITFTGPITVNGAMFDIHDNQHVHIYNGGQSKEDDEEKTSTKKTGGGRPKKSGSKIRAAFCYEGDIVRVGMLYQGLLAFGWIAKNTDQHLFLDLFSGGEVSQRIIWKGDANTLAELFRRLVNERKLVALPEKHTLWVMVSGHFWNQKYGEEYEPDQLRNTHAPKENDKSITLLVNILDPELSMDEVREMMQSQR